MKYSVAVSVALSTLGFIQPATATIGQMGRIGREVVNVVGEIINEVEGDRIARSAGGIVKRQDPPPGVPEFEYERCYNDLAGLVINVTGDQTSRWPKPLLKPLPPSGG
jgi:hypothetical protein